jgi:hypothetical protein
LNLELRFNDNLIASIELPVAAIGRAPTPVSLLFDTGFNGAVALTELTLGKLQVNVEEDCTVQAYKTQTFQGEIFLKSLSVVVRCDGVDRIHNAVVAAVDALGNEFFRDCEVSYTVRPGAYLHVRPARQPEAIL